MLKKITQSFLALLLMMVIGVVSASAKTEKVHATFESPSNTNTTWNSETRTFTWSTTYYNQLRNIGLPSGDISKYKKLVVDCSIKSGEKFRILFYKGGSNLTLYAVDGVNEFWKKLLQMITTSICSLVMKFAFLVTMVLLQARLSSMMFT